MFWVILTILFAIVGGIGLLVRVSADPETEKSAKEGGFVVATVCTALWLVVSLFFMVHTVGQRQVGIVYNFSGTITGKRGPGVVFTAPWQHIKRESTAIQKEVFHFDTSNSAVSKDQQPITATLVVNIQVSPDDAVGLFKSVGPGWKSVLLDGRVPQDFKETTAQFTSPEITLNRPLLRTLTLQRLKRELCPNTRDEPFCINVTDVFVQNVGYSRAYTDAIEAKQVQVQAALRAEAKVAQAKAEAQQAIAKAQGEAQAIELKGRALRNNPEILRLEAIDKLNPNASVVICTGTTCPAFLPGAFGTK